MGYLMTINTSDGETVNNAYFYPEFSAFDKKRHSARLVFLPYRSKAIKNADGAPLQALPKEYNVSRADFDTYFSEEVLKQADVTPYSQAYVYADATLDTDDGSGNKVSYFANASRD